MLRSTLRLGLLAALGLMLPACTHPLNMSVSPGEEPLPTFAEADAHDEPVLDTPADDPSLVSGHDRRAWEKYTIEVPVYRVQSNPAPDYRQLIFIDDTPRQRGEFPTDTGALENSTIGPSHYGEGVFDLLSGAGAIVLSPFFMIGRDVDIPRSPQHRFDMVPETRSEDYERWIRVGAPDDSGKGMAPEPIDEDPEP